MKTILILGGTRLMGRLLVEKLLEQNQHKITLFNRGKTEPQLFPDVEKIIGDRETTDIEKIWARSWDVIIDFSSYHPRSLQPLIHNIKGKVGRYIYISTVSVYDYEAPGIKAEDGKLSPYTEPLVAEEKVTGANYGPKKVACENLLLEADWLDKIILRPSIVYGQYDYTERLYYWMHRVKTQQQFIVPDEGKELSNFTFVNDMVEVLLQSIDIENHRTIYNVTTHTPNTWLTKLNTMKNLLETNPEYVFMPKSILEENKERLKGGLPGWRTNDNLRYDHRRVLEDFSITFTSFEDSIRQMIEYHNKTDLWRESVAGVRVADEQKFIADYKDGAV